MVHVSTKPGHEYGVEELVQQLVSMVDGPEGQLVSMERNIAFVEEQVELLKVQVNSAAARINRQFVVRKIFNVVKMVLDPFLAIKQQAWTTEYFQGLQMDEAQYKKLHADLQEKKEELQRAKEALAAAASATIK